MKHVIVVLIVFFTTQVVAQEPTVYHHDWELWNTVELKFEPVEDLSIDISESFRLKNNISQFKSNVIELTSDYKFNKYLSGGVGYRFTKTAATYLNRIFADLTGRYRMKPFIFSLRTRFHKEFAYLDNTENFWRNKITVKYELSKKIELYVANEWFYQFYFKGNRLQRARYYAGIDFNLPKKFSLELSYMLEQEMNVYAPAMSHTIIATLGYDLGRVFEKNKE